MCTLCEPNRPMLISGITVRTYTVLPSRRISSLISSSSFAEEAHALPSTLTSRPSAAAHHEIAGAGFDHHPLDIRPGGIGRAVGGVLAVLRVGRNCEGAGEEGGGEGDFHGESFQTRWMSVGREGQEKGCARGVRLKPPRPSGCGSGFSPTPSSKPLPPRPPPARAADARRTTAASSTPSGPCRAAAAARSRPRTTPVPWR